MSKHAISFDPEQRVTRPSFKDECDVNRIVSQYARTGMINHLPRSEPKYGDAPDITFQEAALAQAAVATAIEEGWDPTPPEIVAPEASEAVSDDPAPEAPQDAAPDESSG